MVSGPGNEHTTRSPRECSLTRWCESRFATTCFSALVRRPPPRGTQCVLYIPGAVLLLAGPAALGRAAAVAAAPFLSTRSPLSTPAAYSILAFPRSVLLATERAANRARSQMRHARDPSLRRTYTRDATGSHTFGHPISPVCSRDAFSRAYSIIDVSLRARDAFVPSFSAPPFLFLRLDMFLGPRGFAAIAHHVILIRPATAAGAEEGRGPPWQEEEKNCETREETGRWCYL